MVPLWMSSRLAQRVATARNCAPSDAKQQRGSRTLPAGRGLARAVTLVGPPFRLVPASRRRLAVWPGPDYLGRPGPERLDVTWRCRDLPWETNPSQRPARAQVPADSLRAPARGRSPPNRICAKPSAVSWRAQSRCSSHSQLGTSPDGSRPVPPSHPRWTRGPREARSLPRPISG